MKYNNKDSELLSSLACSKNNLLIKNRLDKDKSIDLLYKDDAGVFSAAITRNNHELLQMLLDYMEKSGQMEDEYDRLCNVLSKIYDSEKYSVTKNVKSILYPYISDSMSFESSSEENDTKEDINAKIQEINDMVLKAVKTTDTSTSGGSNKKTRNLSNECSIEPENDFTNMKTTPFEEPQGVDLSGNIHTNDATSDTL